jgi:hypothetical protein
VDKTRTNDIREKLKVYNIGLVEESSLGLLQICRKKQNDMHM